VGKIYTAAEWAEKQAKEAKKDAPKLPRGRPAVAKPKRPRLTLDMIWEKFESVIGDSFPDGDPRDFMLDHMREWKYDHQDLLRAVKKHNKGVESINDLLGSFWEDWADDKLCDVKETGELPEYDTMTTQFVGRNELGEFYKKTNPWWTEYKQRTFREAQALEDAKYASGKATPA
jgi:hypothetical protein